MKPNGRRRWRKWAKGRRVKMHAHHRALYTGARMRKAQPIELAPLPPRPFSPRSLVGMSQGSRKRAAWDHAATMHVLRDHSDPDQLINPEVDAEQERRWSENLKAARRHYRIGERLRPCQGCAACLVCIACENGTCKRRHLKNQHCDGSGVLPARKS